MRTGAISHEHRFMAFEEFAKHRPAAPTINLCCHDVTGGSAATLVSVPPKMVFTEMLEMLEVRKPHVLPLQDCDCQ